MVVLGHEEAARCPLDVLDAPLNMATHESDSFPCSSRRAMHAARMWLRRFTEWIAAHARLSSDASAPIQKRMSCCMASFPGSW